MNAGKVLLICGARGTGKTTLFKTLVKNVDKNALIIYDPAKQHTELYSAPKFVKFDSFTAKIKYLFNAVIGIEESTIHLSNRGYDSDIVDLLVQSNQHGNTVILIYHSLSSIPLYIFNLADGLFLKKTNDTEKRVDQKFDNEGLLKAFKNLQNSRDHYAMEFVRINSF